MSLRRQDILSNLAILGGSLLLLWCICELGFRAFYRIPSQQLGHHQLFMEYDAVLGWHKIPNTTGWHVTSEYAVSEQMNSQGIRGPEYAYEKHPDEYRVLVLGDSFAEGYTVEFHEVFSAVLKDRLNSNANARYYEVINTGSGGYSTDQELLLFQTEGKKYRPDLAVLLFYDNDVWFNNQSKYWRGNKPLFKLDDDGTLTLTNVPVPRPDPVPPPSTTEASFWENPLDTTAIWLSKKSHVYRFINDRIMGTAFLHTLAIKIGLEKVPAENLADQNVIPIPDEFRVYQKRWNADVANAWKITEILLRELRAEVNTVGSNFMIFYVPVRASVYLEEWERVKKQYDITDEEWSIEQIRSDLMAICQRNRFDCIDPLETFRAEAERLRTVGKRLYFLQDGHWNADGHRLVGELLAPYIRRMSGPR
jgi:GDSL-like Lipase/Acylhydrolase family